MPEKDPTTWAAATWVLALSMAIGGGLINWYAKLKRGHVRAFNFIELIGEIFTSGFVGLGVFMLLDSWSQPAGLCAAAAGVSGHMATRLLFAVERAIERQLDAFTERLGLRRFRSIEYRPSKGPASFVLAFHGTWIVTHYKLVAVRRHASKELAMADYYFHNIKD